MTKKIIKIILILIVAFAIVEVLYTQYQSIQNKNKTINKSQISNSSSKSNASKKTTDIILNPPGYVVKNLPKDGLLTTSSTINYYDVVIIKIQENNNKNASNNPYFEIAKIDVKNSHDKTSSFRLFTNSKIYNIEGELAKLDSLKVGDKIRIESIINLGKNKSSFNINIRKI